MRPDSGSPSLDQAIQFSAAGTTRAGDLTIDRLTLTHSGGLQMPVLSIHGAAPATRGVLLWIGDRGKLSGADWQTVSARVSDGYHVVSFDPRGLGETRMRFKAESVDVPGASEHAEEDAYVSPISGVLANHVYNALLTGRPYYLQLIEDVEIATRFARQQTAAPGRCRSRDTG